MESSNFIRKFYYTLPNNQLILPCQYGIRCKNRSNCPYWHNPMIKIVPLCRYGSKCQKQGQTCPYSHDMGYQGAVACEYGLSCTNEKCKNIHPIEANKTVIGKYNLLYKAVHCTLRLNTRLFDIIVFDSSKLLCANLTQVLNLNYEIDIDRERYMFATNHIYQIFSNHKLGGGTLGYGNLQEEKIMLTSSLLQYLLHNSHHDNESPLSNNLEQYPIVVNTMVVVKDNSYINYQHNSDSPHYGRSGLALAYNKEVVNYLYNTIDNPIPIKAMCIAVPKLKNCDGSCYNETLLVNIFQTLYKAFVTSIIADINEASTNDCHIHIGNIGCGAFGHNYNTIFVLQYLAIGCAYQFIKPTKNFFIKYHAYDDKTYNGLTTTAIPALKSWMFSGKNIKTILSELRNNQILVPDLWAKKL